MAPGDAARTAYTSSLAVRLLHVVQRIKSYQPARCGYGYLLPVRLRYFHVGLINIYAAYAFLDGLDLRMAIRSVAVDAADFAGNLIHWMKQVVAT